MCYSSHCGFGLNFWRCRNFLLAVCRWRVDDHLFLFRWNFWHWWECAWFSRCWVYSRFDYTVVFVWSLKMSSFVFQCSYADSFVLKGCVADEKVVGCAVIDEVLSTVILKIKSKTSNTIVTGPALEGFDNRRSLWPFVNKIEKSVVNLGRSIFLSCQVAKFWNKSSHILILLSVCLWVVVFSFLGSLSSADKTEESKDMVKCQIHA